MSCNAEYLLTRILLQRRGRKEIKILAVQRCDSDSGYHMVISWNLTFYLLPSSELGLFCGELSVDRHHPKGWGECRMGKNVSRILTGGSLSGCSRVIEQPDSAGHPTYAHEGLYH